MEFKKRIPVLSLLASVLLILITDLNGPVSAKSLAVSESTIESINQSPNGADPKNISHESTVVDGARQENAEIWRFSDTQTCNIYENEPLHALMDRICELCHEMFSHEKPNMRVECRSDCFRSDNFKRCLKLFNPMKKHNHRHKMRKHQTII